MSEAARFLRDGSMTQRYHTVPTLRNETVGHHSWNVAMLCYVLTDYNPSRDLLMAALLHDVAEVEVGDIPAPTKRQLDIRKDVAAMEDEVLARVGIAIPTLSQEDAFLLKLADVLDGYLFCRQEELLGNKMPRFLQTKQNYHAYIFQLMTPIMEKIDKMTEEDRLEQIPNEQLLVEKVMDLINNGVDNYV